MSKEKIRKFSTGATRDSQEGKNEYIGFLDPTIIEEFGNYMTKHRIQSNGQLRDAANWKKGITKNSYIESLFRHFIDLWFLHLGYKRFDKKDGHELTVKEVCSACLFNIQGYLYEELKEESKIKHIKE